MYDWLFANKLNLKPKEDRISEKQKTARNGMRLIPMQSEDSNMEISWPIQSSRKQMFLLSCIKTTTP